MPAGVRRLTKSHFLVRIESRTSGAEAPASVERFAVEIMQPNGFISIHLCWDGRDEECNEK